MMIIINSASTQKHNQSHAHASEIFKNIPRAFSLLTLINKQISSFLSLIIRQLQVTMMLRRSSISSSLIMMKKHSTTKFITSSTPVVSFGIGVGGGLFKASPHLLQAHHQEEMKINDDVTNLHRHQEPILAKQQNRHHEASSSSSFPTTRTNNNGEKQKDDGTSLYFASGFKIPSALADVIKTQQEQHLPASSSSSSSSSSLPRIYLTPAQVATLNLKVNDGESPMTVQCPPGTTRKKTLTLFRIDQTSKPDFFPNNLQSDAVFMSANGEKKGANNKASSSDYFFYKNKKKFKTQNSSFATNAEDSVENNNNDDNQQVATRHPHYFGGTNHGQEYKTLPRNVWPTLASISSQHGWTSTLWYTRSGMTNACLRPKVDQAVLHPRRVLPVVVRLAMHKNRGGINNNNNNNNNNAKNEEHQEQVSAVNNNNNTNTAVFHVYQTLWNGDQLEPDNMCADSANEPLSLSEELLLEESDRYKRSESIVAQIERELAVADAEHASKNKSVVDNHHHHHQQVVEDAFADLPTLSVGDETLKKAIASFDAYPFSSSSSSSSSSDKNCEQEEEYDQDEDGCLLPTLEEDIETEKRAVGLI